MSTQALDHQSTAYATTPLMTGRKKVITLKVDVTILEEMDRLWRELGYASRSQFIREAITHYMLVARARRSGDDICVCRCSEARQAERLEDYIAERLGAKKE